MSTNEPQTENNIISNPNQANTNNNSFIDEESSISQIEEEKYNKGRWTKEEHMSFIKGVLISGVEGMKSIDTIQTRSPNQIQAHAKKYFLHLMEINMGNENEISANIKNTSQLLSKKEIDQLSKEDIEKRILALTNWEKLKCFENDIKDKKDTSEISKEAKTDKEEEEGSCRMNKRKSDGGEVSQNDEGGVDVDEDNYLDIVRDNDEGKSIINDLSSSNIFNNEQEKEMNIESVFGESKFDDNERRMEELKKISEVLLILTKTKQNALSKGNNNNSHAHQQKEHQKLKGNLTSKSNGKGKGITNGHCLNKKGNNNNSCSSNDSLPKYCQNKRERDSSLDDSEKLIHKSTKQKEDTNGTNNNRHNNYSPKSLTKSKGGNRNNKQNLTVNTNELLQLFKSMNTNYLSSLNETNKSINEMNQSLNLISQESSQEKGKTKEEVKTIDKSIIDTIMNTYLKQQQEQSQQYINPIPKMNLLYSNCSANINQLNQYYLPCTNNNNSNAYIQPLPPQTQLQSIMQTQLESQLLPLIQSQIPPVQYQALLQSQIQPSLIQHLIQSQLSSQLPFNMHSQAPSQSLQWQAQFQLQPSLQFQYQPHHLLNHQHQLDSQIYQPYLPQTQLQTQYSQLYVPIDSVDLNSSLLSMYGNNSGGAEGITSPLYPNPSIQTRQSNHK